MIENFIKGGAFGLFRQNASGYAAMVRRRTKRRFRPKQNALDGTNLDIRYDAELKTTSRPQHEQVKEFPKQVLYNYENEVLGLYMTGSPLDDYDDIAERYNFDFNTGETMAYVPDGSEDGEKVIRSKKRYVTTGGILRDIRIVVGKDNNRMGFGVLEDKYDSIEVALYGTTYERFKTLFGADAFVVVKGNLAESRDGYKINIREIINPREEHEEENTRRKKSAAKTTLYLKWMNATKKKYAKVVDLLQQYEGSIP